MPLVLKKIKVILLQKLERTGSYILKLSMIRSRWSLYFLIAYVVLLIAVGIFPGMHAQASSFGKTVIRNSVHFPTFFILTLFFYNYTRSDFCVAKILHRYSIFFSALGAFTVGIFIEILQLFSVTRTPSAIDIFLKFAGIMIFVVGISFYNEIRWVHKMQVGVPSLLTAYHSCFFQEFEVLQDKLRLLEVQNKQKNKSILVCSMNPREGKSTVLLSLAFALVQKENRQVALVDLNFHNPQFHSIFGLPQYIGAIELLQGVESLQYVKQASMVPGLDVITIGDQRLGRYQPYSSRNIERGLNELKDFYEITLIELTPLSVQLKNSISIPLLASLVDRIVLVIEKAATDRRMIRQYLKLFEGNESKICGTIINNRLKVA